MGKAKLVSKNGLLVSVLVFVATTAAILVLSSRFIAAPHFLLVQSVCHHPAPLIGPRVWQTIEADVIPRGSKDWDRVGILFDQWNNGNLQIDESHFYENRPEVWGQTGARQPGYAWFKFVTDPKDQKPVAFVPRAPPARVLLPWCERTVEKHIEKNPASDVSVCIIVRNEERALREWINYYLFLGVGRIAVYDDMSVDRTSEIARAYGDAVSYMKWEPSPKGWEIDQMDMYLDCASKERDRGAKWVGNLDVDEYLVFDDPNQKVDSFLHAFDRHHPNVGSVSFNWRMMSSDEVSLPDPAFTVLDVQYACSDRSDERHHVKTFVKLEAFRGVENPHFQLLKEGFRQYDVSGGGFLLFFF